jgi:hypothetical protein
MEEIWYLRIKTRHEKDAVQLRTSKSASVKSIRERMQSRSRAPECSYKGFDGLQKCARFFTQGLMYWRQLIRWAATPLSIPVEITDKKSSVSFGAKLASRSLNPTTNVEMSPGIMPAKDLSRLDKDATLRDLNSPLDAMIGFLS